MNVLILAAGQGTRMRSRTPKVLHELCGRPLIAWPIEAALGAGARRVIVVGGPDRALAPHLPDDVVLAVQSEPRGTGDAVLAAAEHIDDDDVLVLSGDVPLLTADFLTALHGAHRDARAAATMATEVLDDPSGYGRVVRAADGTVQRVVETKTAGDATPEELRIREVNGGVYAFGARALLDALGQVRPDNAQGEYYLPDALKVLRAAGERVAAHEVDDPSLLLGVNDRVDLARVRTLAQRRINEAHMRAGVTIVDSSCASIDWGVEIGGDTVIEPGCVLRGATRIGGDCRIGPLSTLVDAVVGDGAEVLRSHLHGCEVRAGARVGPFAYLRPGALLREQSKAGTFVEIKNSDIGAGAKVPHLSYIGDADVGAGANLGAATITANYDGHSKHRTVIGAGVRTGVDTTLVAPVTVGDDAYTGAGSVITMDVPPGALGIARERQRNVDGYASRRSPSRPPSTL